VQEKYLKGVLGVDRETPGYVMTKECKRNRLRVKAGKRVWRENGWKGILEKKENKNRRRREKNTIRETGMQWKRGKIKIKRNMDKCRAEWNV
jgi:hypothetical protein